MLHNTDTNSWSWNSQLEKKNSQHSQHWKDHTTSPKVIIDFVHRTELHPTSSSQIEQKPHIAIQRSKTCWTDNLPQYSWSFAKIQPVASLLLTPLPPPPLLPPQPYSFDFSANHFDSCRPFSLQLSPTWLPFTLSNSYNDSPQNQTRKIWG